MNKLNGVYGFIDKELKSD